MRILIADDEALTRMGLRAMLQEMGHLLVGTAADGVTALQMARESKPDLAVLDIKMPGMDGLAVAKAIAEQCPLPVVMLTAYSERELVQRAAATETVQAYLVKPIREEELAPAIELASARFSEWQALQQEAADRHEALATREIVDQAKGLLMKRDGLTEGEAFLEIQHRARRHRRSMRRVAEEILRPQG
ncbi:MAG TPA: response regulator [Anaerolineae bacterium]|nr:response regulator [Anaerolineae bacterium]